MIALVLASASNKVFPLSIGERVGGEGYQWQLRFTAAREYFASARRGLGMKDMKLLAAMLTLAAFCATISPAAATYFWDKKNFPESRFCNNRVTIEEAIKECELALRARQVPGRYLPEFLVALGSDYAMLGQFGNAILYYNKAVQLNPKFADAYFARARAYEQIGQYAQAIGDYSVLVGLKPDDAVILNQRCWTRAVQGDQLYLAIGDCNKSLELEPGEANTLDSRALVYYRLGNYTAAIADANSALAADPKMKGSLYVRGIAKLKSGDTSGGNADIEAAKALDAKIADTYADYGVKP